MWNESGPLAERLGLVERGLAALAPDVVGLEEARERSGAVENTARRLATALEMHAVWEPATSWGGGVEGLAILSRTPARSSRAATLPGSDETETRKVLVAELDAFVFAVTHLTHRLADDEKREAQAVAADAFVREVAGGRPAVFAGDFNAAPDRKAVRFLRGFWIDAWDACHPGDPGLTFAAHNTFADPELGTDRRIDYVFVSPGIRVRDCSIVFDQPGDRGIFPSDHFGVMADLDLPA